MGLDFDRFLEGGGNGEKAPVPSKLVFLQKSGTEFFETVACLPVEKTFQFKIHISSFSSITFLLLMYQVMLAAGNEVPTVQVALRLSFAKRVFFSTIMRGSSLGSSITCITAVRMSV